MHDVVAAPAPREMPQHAGAESQRRPDPPSPGDVELHPRTDRDHIHAGDLGLLSALPLAQSQIGHLVPAGGQRLREIAVPALGAANGVGEKAVIDDADAHAFASIPDVN